MMPIYKLLIALIILTTVSCRKIHPIEKFCGLPVTRCSGDRLYDNFDNLPPEIKNSATEELLLLIPQDALDKEIKFVECLFIDSCSYTREYEWEVPQYYLNFEWLLPEDALISKYCFSLILNSKGELLHPVELPNCIDNNENSEVISIKDFKRVWTKAMNKGYHSYEVSYDTLNQILIIDLVKYKDLGDSDILTHENVIKINAHSGTVMSE
ncbi:MAG: hypothetical protein DWQ02_23355 [Bacteroidetes bacterium]|nr:MAG: hypothetical protein DWQ02_23355 [Bacteroidota bacterium]